MILVTGAGGKTGRAIVQRLAREGRRVRAVVRREAQVLPLLDLGAAESRLGDMCDPSSLVPAFSGISAVYHIPPNVHPHEERMGEIAIQLSRECGVGHFVYHSVLRPCIQAMPHHLRKARVEERLFASGLDFTILQPGIYMQNTLAGLDDAQKSGLYKVPYPVDTPFSMVDLDEVAEAAAGIIGKPEHFGATYELSGGEILTPADVAEQMGAALGAAVEAQEVDLLAWGQDAERTGMGDDRIETLMKMFRYYAEHGFWGNANTLAALLGRSPKTYAQFLAGLDLG